MLTTRFAIHSAITNMAVGRQNMTLERGQTIVRNEQIGQLTYEKNGKNLGIILSLTKEIVTKLELKGRIVKKP